MFCGVRGSPNGIDSHVEDDGTQFDGRCKPSTNPLQDNGRQDGQRNPVPQYRVGHQRRRGKWPSSRARHFSVDSRSTYALSAELAARHRSTDENQHDVQNDGHAA